MGGSLCAKRRSLEIGGVEAHLLSDSVDERIDPDFDCFCEPPFAQWTTHAVTHLAEYAFGKVRLDSP